MLRKITEIENGGIERDKLYWNKLREYINLNKKHIHLIKIIPKTQKDIGFQDFFKDFELDKEGRRLIKFDSVGFLYFQKEKFWFSIHDFIKIDFNKIPEDVKNMKDYILKKFRSRY